MPSKIKIIESKTCLCCGLEFTTKQRKIPKIFCSEKCRTRYNARARYEKIKNTDEYKNQRKIYFKKWLNDNRAHFNDLCRERSRIGGHDRYIERVKNNVCVECGQAKEEERQNKRLCIACSKKAAIYGKRHYNKERSKLKSNVPT